MTVLASHKKVTFVCKHDVLLICSPAFVIFGPFISFSILSVKSCFLSGLKAFLPLTIRRFFTALALISVPVKAKSLGRLKLVFLRSNLPCLITKASSLGVVLHYLLHFPLLCGFADPVLVACFSRQWIGLHLNTWQFLFAKAQRASIN